MPATLRDKARIALGLAILETKPEVMDVETYIIHLRNQYPLPLCQTLSTAPSNLQYQPQIERVSKTIEQQYLAKIKALEGEVTGLKRKVVVIEVEGDSSEQDPQNQRLHPTPTAQPSTNNDPHPNQSLCVGQRTNGSEHIASDNDDRFKQIRSIGNARTQVRYGANEADVVAMGMGTDNDARWSEKQDGRKSDIMVVGEILDRLLVENQSEGVDERTNLAPSNTSQSLGILEALFLRTKQQSRSNSDLYNQVSFDCAVEIINKLSILLIRSLSGPSSSSPSASSSKQSSHPSRVEKTNKDHSANIKLVFRLLEYVLSGLVASRVEIVSSSTSTSEEEAQSDQVRWNRLILLLQEKIFVPSIKTFRSSSISKEPNSRANQVGLYPRKTLEESIIAIVRKLNQTSPPRENDGIASLLGSSIAEIVSYSSMLELVQIVEDFNAGWKKRGAEAGSGAGSRRTSQDTEMRETKDEKKATMEETIFHLSRMISGSLPFLPMDVSAIWNRSQKGNGNRPSMASANGIITRTIKSRLVDLLSGLLGGDSGGSTDGVNMKERLQAELGESVMSELLRLAEELMMAEGEEGFVKTWLMNGLEAGNVAMDVDVDEGVRS